MKHDYSRQLFAKAETLIPGGVNSPVRAFSAVGGNPIIFEKAEKAYLYDVDDNRYIDYVGSWGPMIHGHGHPAVIGAVKEAAERGLSFGACCRQEAEFVEKIKSHMPALEQCRLVNSGTEATMSAIRLARGHTGRDKFVKFSGCYHGHSDNLLVRAGSGALTFGRPSSAGVPKATVSDTLVADFNDLCSVERLFDEYPEEIAAVILEPIAGNMNYIPGRPDFIKGLRELCDCYGALLIFDEVMTGFRVALGGATSIYAVEPDLITLGKVIGGGMPIGLFGGKREIMQSLAPTGPVYQAGTLSGNPISLAAGLATLRLLEEPGFFADLEAKTKYLVEGLSERAEQNRVALYTDYRGGMFGYFFTQSNPVELFEQASQCDTSAFVAFFRAMIEQGVYLAPSAFEAGFVSAAHTKEDLDHTLEAAERAFASLPALAEV